MAEKFEIDPSTVRSKEQLAATKLAAECGCAWCLPEKDQKSPVVGEFVWWRVRHNAFPKPGRDMYLIVLKRHASRKEMTNEERVEYFAALNWLIEHFGLRGGGVIHRFGDKKLNASSLPDDHFFVSVVEPDGTQPVAETLVKDRSPEKEAERAARLK